MAENFDWIEDITPPTLDKGKWVIDVDGMMSEEKHNIQQILFDKGWNWKGIRKSRNPENLKRRLCGGNVGAYYLNDSNGHRRITWSPEGVNPNIVHQYVHGSTVLETYGIYKPFQTKLPL